MSNFKVQQTVLLQDTNIPGSPWRVGRVIEIVNYLGTPKYIVDVEDHRGRIIYRAALPLDDERLRGMPSGYPEAYRWDPRRVGIVKRDFVRSEFVWAAVRVRRQYGVNQSSEVWVSAMYIEKICPGRHCVLVVGGADADSDADPQAAILSAPSYPGLGEVTVTLWVHRRFVECDSIASKHVVKDELKAWIKINNVAFMYLNQQAANKAMAQPAAVRLEFEKMLDERKEGRKTSLKTPT
ncbi:hypothetical protein BJ912DRAFT_926794 [Pholiota molesta]|nr:hypothetical protein BJ912DRAFT_926794 [Pholiota molesta]